MLTRSNGERPDSSLESLCALLFYDVCYLTRDQIFPVGTNYTSPGQAMSCRSRGLSGLCCLVWTGFSGQSWASGDWSYGGSDQKLPAEYGYTRWRWWKIQSSRVSPGVSLPALGGFTWIREGFVRLWCQTSVYPQKPFYFLIVSEISSWHLSLQTWPVDGNGRFIPSLCFMAGGGQGEGWGFFCLTLKRYPLLFICFQLILLAGRHGGFPARAGRGGGSWQWLPWCESIGNNTRPPQMHTCLSVDCCGSCLHVLGDN